MIGLRIATLRKEYKYTQEELANKLNVSRSTITCYEKDIVLPPPDKLISLAEIFDTSVDYILGKVDVRKNIPNANTDIALNLKILADLSRNNDNITFNGNKISQQYRIVLLELIDVLLNLGEKI